MEQPKFTSEHWALVNDGKLVLSYGNGYALLFDTENEALGRIFSTNTRAIRVRVTIEPIAEQGGEHGTT